MSEDGTATGTGSLPNRSPLTQFVSATPGSEDFHLAAGSDAIDSCADLSASFSDDVDGDLRPQSAAWDMGADESTTPPSTPTPTVTQTPTATATPTSSATATATDTFTPTAT